MSTSTQNSLTVDGGETLDTLHNNKLATLAGEEMMEYLLNAMEYLKTGDIHGWKEKFLPAPVVEEKPRKRLRQCPSTAPYCPLPCCTGCGADQLIDDVAEGQVVCINCGLILYQGVFTADSAHCDMDRLMTGPRVHIHRYSRIVHFRTTMRLMQGESSPVIEDELLLRMQAELDGGKDPITVESVSKMLRKLKISRKYRRHRWWIAAALGGEILPVFDAEVVLPMLKMFRVLEYHWDRHKKEIAPGRKVFFSYRFIFHQFALALGRPDMTGPHHLLKSAKLAAYQKECYRRSCKYTNFPEPK